MTTSVRRAWRPWGLLEGADPVGGRPRPRSATSPRRRTPCAGWAAPIGQRQPPLPERSAPKAPSQVVPAQVLDGTPRTSPTTMTSPWPRRRSPVRKGEGPPLPVARAGSRRGRQRRLGMTAAGRRWRAGSAKAPARAPGAACTATVTMLVEHGRDGADLGDHGWSCRSDGIRTPPTWCAW